MKTHQKLGMVVALIMSGSAAANTVGIYDNISGLGSVTDGQGLVGSSAFLANKFSTLDLCPGGCTLGNITLNLTSPDHSILGFSLQVVADNAGVPGNTLTTLNNPTEFTSSFGNNVFTPNGNLTLAENTYYWVKFSTTNESSVAYWNRLNNQGVQGQPNELYFNYDGYADSVSPSNLLMKVEGTPLGIVATPIPGTVWMMGSTLLGFLTTRLRKSR